MSGNSLPYRLARLQWARLSRNRGDTNGRDPSTRSSSNARSPLASTKSHETSTLDFVRATNYPTDGMPCLVNDGHQWKESLSQNWRDLAMPQTGRHPAVCISWSDATAYVSWLSEHTGAKYRLLSAAEWEYVARAGTSSPWYWGDTSEVQCQYANGADESEWFPLGHRLQRWQPNNFAGRLIPT